jgi:hypothetical protein
MKNETEGWSVATKLDFFKYLINKLEWNIKNQNMYEWEFKEPKYETMEQTFTYDWSVEKLQTLLLHETIQYHQAHHTDMQSATSLQPFR